MRYLVITLPSDPAERAARITFERAHGTLYTRPDASVVLVRASWSPPASSSLVSLDAIPGDWTEITE